MASDRSRRRSPTLGLFVGLVVTLTAVVAYSSYIAREISGLRQLQTDLTDRNRKDTLQLLRIQNDLNLLALAMRDMLDPLEPLGPLENDQRYPLAAWSSQFDRIRADLDDALRREEETAVARRTPEQRQYLADSVKQFWDATDRMFAGARAGREADARADIQVSLQARQAALGTTVARLLVENNASEDETALRVQSIYRQVQRQVFWFLGATLAAIVLTSLSLIRVNRRQFAEMAVLSERRQELARQLIAARESTLREVARELHDQFGQVLTAIGSMLTRAARHAPDDSPLEAELHEVCEIAQATLDDIRRLSQTLHPSILDDAGLEDTIEWYVPNVSRQLGIKVTYARSGDSRPVDSRAGIHIYRVLQEALNNAARHSGSQEAEVRLGFRDSVIELTIEDHGRGLSAASERRGLGIITMSERAELLGGTLEFLTPPGGGTLVRLRVPVPEAPDHGE